MKPKTALFAAIAAIGLTTQATAAPPQKAELPRYPAPKNLDFSQVAGSLRTIDVNGQSVQYRAFEHIVYVMKPADTRYQIMNVYIPEAYFQGGSINGFTKDTAPIFFPNNVGGYMPGEAGQPETDSRGSGKRFYAALGARQNNDWLNYEWDIAS